MSLNFTVSVIDSLEQLEDFLPQWLSFLESEPLGTNAFNDPRFILADWKTQKKDENSQQMIIVVRESEKICCIAPLRNQQRAFPIEVGFKKVCSVKIRQMKCSGDSFIFCDLGQENKAMFDHVFQFLKQKNRPFDIWYLMDVRTNTPFYEYCDVKQIATGARVRKTFQTPQTAYRIRLGESMDAMVASLSKKRRKSIRNTLKNYNAEPAENRFVKITQPDQVEFLLSAMQQVSDRAWQSTARGLREINTEQKRLFFQELARQGLLRSYVLERNGVPIAYRNGFQAGKYFNGQENRYDRVNYEKLYPGIVCLYKQLEELYQDNTPEIVDMGLGDYGGYKSVWANDNVESMTLYITGSFKGAVVVQTQTAINTVVRIAKSTLDRLGVKERVLNFFKGKRSSSKQHQQSENDSAEAS